MAESPSHCYLVREMSNWIIKNRLNNESHFLLVDNTENKPPMVFGYVPDVCVLCGPQNEFIIGEAKTYDDLDNGHTENQIRAFLRKCHSMENSMLVLAVPWDRASLAKSIVRGIKHQDQALNDVHTFVIDKLFGIDLEQAA